MVREIDLSLFTKKASRAGIVACSARTAVFRCLRRWKWRGLKRNAEISSKSSVKIGHNMIIDAWPALYRMRRPYCSHRTSPKWAGGFTLCVMIDHESVSGESIKTSIYPLESPTHHQHQAHNNWIQQPFSYSPTHLVQKNYLSGSWIWRSLPSQQLPSSRPSPMPLQLPSKIVRPMTSRSHSLPRLLSSPGNSRPTVAYLKSVRSIFYRSQSIIFWQFNVQTMTSASTWSSPKVAQHVLSTGLMAASRPSRKRRPWL